MFTNDQIVLDKILARQRHEIDPTASESCFFEFFTAQRVLNDLDLTYDEIESGLIGGSGDGGIDAFYILVNGQLVQDEADFNQTSGNVQIELVILQSKTGTGFSETPIDKFLTVSDDIFNLSIAPETLRASYSDELIETIERFRACLDWFLDSMPKLKVRFLYASRGTEPNDSVLHKANKITGAVQRHFPEAECTVTFLGASELVALARQVPKRNFSLPLAENPISPEGQIGFVCLVDLRAFYDFITDESSNLRYSIFEANVRDYQAGAPVNAEIQNSLKTPGGEDFWWLNNGVSILASDASFGGKKLTIQSPRIVNGLQTSREIYRYFRGKNAQDDLRKILVRVMVADEGSRDRIIKATNSQTYVPLPSLRATDKIHHDIEDYLLSKDIYYERRKNYYKNRRKPIDRTLTIKQLAQAVQSIVVWRPDEARARPTDLFRSDDTYTRMFNPDYPLDVYYVCADGMRRVTRALKDAGLTRREINDMQFYVAMHSVACVSSCHRPVASEIAELDTTVLNEDRVGESLQFVHREYERLGGDNEVAKGRDLVSVVRTDIEKMW